MKSIVFSCLQDVKRLLTNALFWVLTATLVIIVLVVDLALPKEVAEQELTLLSVNAPMEAPLGMPADSAADVRAAVEKGDAVGFVYDEAGLTIVHPGLSQKSLNIYALELMGGAVAPVQILPLNETTTRQIPFHLRFTPVFICFEALMVGFMLGGALMLSEKQDGTVRALRVSPFSVSRYVLSKTLLFSCIGTLYASLICLLTVGIAVNWAIFLPLSFFGTAVFTMIGLAYTSPFRDMSGWFFSMVVLLSINMLPVISYTSPSFTPFWMRLIPSYPILNAYRAAMFGGAADWGYIVAGIGIWGGISYVLSLIFVNKKHLKGAV